MIAGIWIKPVPSAIAVFKKWYLKGRRCTDDYTPQDLWHWLNKLMGHPEFEEAIADEDIRKEFDEIEEYINNF